jgi:hypothetical protein
MNSLRDNTSKSISSGIIAAIEGTSENWAQVGKDIAQSFLEKSVDMVVNQLYTLLAQVFKNAFGTSAPPVEAALMAGAQTSGTALVTSSTTAGTNLSQGGILAGQAIVESSLLAKANLSGGSEGGSGSGLFSSLFKGESGSGLFSSWFKGGSGSNMSSSLLQGWNNPAKFPALFGSGSGSGLFSSGNMFSIVPHQHGGIIGGPTLALMGEAGQEAVFPLTQTGSGLGIMGAAPNVSVVVNNNTGVQADVETKIDNNQIEITLSKIVAKNIARQGDIYREISRAWNVNPKAQRRS